MFTNVAKVWGRNILRQHLVTPYSKQKRHYRPEISITENCKNRDIARQAIRIRLTTQNRDHATFLNPRYAETSISENSEEFPYNSMAMPEAAATEQELREFKSILPEVFDDLINAYTDVPILQKHFAKVLDFNLGRDKQALGFIAVDAYKMFAAPEDLNPANIKLANILGWCVNLLLGAYQMTDDITDASKDRNEKICWYKRRDVGMQAINDAMLMKDGIYLLLRKHLSGLECYLPVTEWFHDMAAKTLVGQTLDNICEADGKPPLNIFTWDTYDYLVKHKGSYAAYILPTVLGILLADKYNNEIYKQTDAISSELGLYFTAQNDTLDCYGNPAVTGKVGTDIVAGKCSWLVVKALQLATPAQKQILSEHYGRFEQESEAKVRTLYDELGVLDEFLIFEENSFNKVCKLIQQVPNEMHRKFFYKTVEATYGRKT